MPFLTPFLVGRVPLKQTKPRQKIGYPSSNLSNLEDPSPGLRSSQIHGFPRWLEVDHLPGWGPNLEKHPEISHTWSLHDPLETPGRYLKSTPSPGPPAPEVGSGGARRAPLPGRGGLRHPRRLRGDLVGPGHPPGRLARAERNPPMDVLQGPLDRYILQPFHGCWETFFPFFASCGLVVEIQPLNCYVFFAALPTSTKKYVFFTSRIKGNHQKQGAFSSKIQGKPPDTCCFFNTQIKGDHHLQGHVQVYNARIPVFPLLFFLRGRGPIPSTLVHSAKGC